LTRRRKTHYRGMLKKAFRVAAVILAGILCIALFVIVFAHANRPATVRGYFWLEGKAIDKWPDALGKAAVERFAIFKLAPALCRIGVLGPARIQVEPHASFLLD